MREKSYRLIMLMIMSFLFLLGCHRQIEIEEEVAVAVEIAAINYEDISQWVTLATKLDAKDTAIIVPKTPGLEVTRLDVGLGERVESGEFLFELDKSMVRRQVEQSKVLYDQAQRNYEQQRQQALEPNAPQFAQMSMESASNQLEQARTAYVNSLEQLGQMEYFAPISGIISQLNIQQNRMALNDQPAIVISNPNILKGRLQVSRSLMSDLEVGQEVIVMVDDQEKYGKISAVNSVVDPRSNLHVIEILVDNEDEELSVGALGRVQIERMRREEVAVIPRRALLSEGEKNYVFVVNGERVKRKEIELGVANEDKVEVLSGLDPEDFVVVRGQQYVEDETLVQVVRGDSQ